MKSSLDYNDKRPVVILAIESSCDETSASVVADGTILSNVIATQSVHQSYGGVVPELASRAHQQHIVPVVYQALSEAKITKTMLSAVAFTQGPGLLGALLVGSSFAKSLAYGLDIPLIGINHMQAHILAHFIEDPRPTFPFLCLTASGGHTQIVRIDDYLSMTIIGQTQDDAVGEAFDKAAKIMGFPYPGGPLIDQYAKTGNARAFSFPNTSMPGYDFSFSGIKTAFLNFLNKEKSRNPDFVQENSVDICASIQQKLVDMLLDKLALAARDTGIRQVAIAGGVSANTALRENITQLGRQEDWRIFIPRLEYCTDNAAMIAMAAHYKYLGRHFADLHASPDPRLQLESGN